jgi:hypothetical protein
MLAAPGEQWGVFLHGERILGFSRQLKTQGQVWARPVLATARDGVYNDGEIFRAGGSGDASFLVAVAVHPAACNIRWPRYPMPMKP